MLCLMVTIAAAKCTTLAKLIHGKSPWWLHTGLQATRRSMTLVGIPVEQQDACFRLVAAVLHMGNLEFAEGAEQDSSQLAPASAKHLDACAELLGAQPDGLLKALTTRTRQTVDGQCPCSRTPVWQAPKLVLV
jgi:myosin heavy subunit